MNTLKKVLNIVRKDVWANTFDMTYAYFNIMIHPVHHKYLCFYIARKAYQYHAVPFGPKISPKGFYQGGISGTSLRLAVYLDDWFLLNAIKKITTARSRESAQSPRQIRFPSKCRQIRTRTNPGHCVYLGRYLLTQGLVMQTKERIEKI